MHYFQEYIIMNKLLFFKYSKLIRDGISKAMARVEKFILLKSDSISNFYINLIKKKNIYKLYIYLSIKKL